MPRPQSITERVVLDTLQSRWLEQPELVQVLRDTAIRTCQQVFEGRSPYPLAFTDHGPEHCTRVLWWAIQHAKHMEAVGFTKFTASEMLFLAASCYLHDVGMGLLPKGADASTPVHELRTRVRKEHPQRVQDVLKEHAARFEPLRRVDTGAYAMLADLCMSHATSLHREKVTVLSEHSTHDLRLAHLARILLVADELDLCETRVDMFDEQFRTLDRVSRAHWLHHHYIVDAMADLPLVRMKFEFPGEPGDYSPFVDWTLDKLNKQFAMAQEGMQNGDRRYFDIRVVADARYNVIERQPCPAETLDFVKDELAGLVMLGHSEAPAAPLRRPRQLLPKSDEQSGRSAGAHVLKQVVEDVFRSFWTFNDDELIDRAYVKTEENVRTMADLAGLIAGWTATRRSKDSGPELERGIAVGQTERELTRKLFLVVGNTGVGKSSYLAYLLRTLLPHQIGESSEYCLRFRHDCIGLTTRDSVLVNLLREFSKWVGANISPDEHQLLKERGLILEEGRVPGLSGEEARNRLCALLDALVGTTHIAGPLHRDTSGRPLEDGVEVHAEVTARFVVFALDNIDRIANQASIRHVFQDVAYITKSTGCVVLMPVRRETLAFIKQRGDELGAREIPVEPPPLREVLERRLEYAFGASKSKERIRAMLEPYRGSYIVEIADVEAAVRNAAKLLVERWDDHHFLPEIAGDNIRVALDLVRRVLSSPHLTADQFLRLRRGEISHPYSLVRHLLIGDMIYYNDYDSPFPNLFARGESSRSYFIRVNILDLLVNTSWASDPARVSVRDLCTESLRRYKYTPADTRHCVFELLRRDIPLVGVHEVSSDMPRLTLDSSGDLKDDLVLTAMAAGQFVLNRLSHQLVYIQSVMVDTPLPAPLAEDIARSYDGSWDERKLAVESYIRFLEERETAERNEQPLATRFTVSRTFMSEIRRRLTQQLEAVSKRLFP